MDRLLLKFGVFGLGIHAVLAQDFTVPPGFALPAECEAQGATAGGNIGDVCLLCPNSNGEVQFSTAEDIEVVISGTGASIVTNCRDFSLFGICGSNPALATSCGPARTFLFNTAGCQNSCTPLSQFGQTPQPTDMPTDMPTPSPTPSPTAAVTPQPTDTPTDMPTPSPTPSPTSGAAVNPNPTSNVVVSPSPTSGTVATPNPTLTSIEALMTLDQCPVGGRCPADRAEVCVSRAPRQSRESKAKSTKAPTMKSTKAPSVKATKGPTAKSTKAPTAKGTGQVKSTKAPSFKSTKAPSFKGASKVKSTKAPAVKSTKAPTAKSTKAKSTKAKSTKAPSVKSTKAPTAKSTKAPSVKSTKAPSAKSTKAPSVKSAKAPKQPKLVTRCVLPENGLWMRETFVSCGACDDDR